MKASVVVVSEGFLIADGFGGAGHCHGLTVGQMRVKDLSEDQGFKRGLRV
jgi:hypothetical protein